MTLKHFNFTVNVEKPPKEGGMLVDFPFKIT